MAAVDATPTIEDPAYFDRLADVEVSHWWSRGMWRLASYWLDDALRGRRGLLALDVGCGTGQTAVRLAGRPEVARVFGLDPSGDALKHARRRHDLPLIRGGATDLPLAAGSVNLITCLDVIQHVPPGRAGDAAAEIARVLSPGGLALVRANGRGWSGDSSSYRLADLRGLFAGAGLLVRRASYANFLPAVAQEVCGRISRAGQGGRSHPAGGGLAIGHRRKRTDPLMTAVSTAEAVAAGRFGLNLPFGHSTLVLAEKPRKVEADSRAGFWSVVATNRPDGPGDAS